MNRRLHAGSVRDHESLAWWRFSQGAGSFSPLFVHPAPEKQFANLGRPRFSGTPFCTTGVKTNHLLASFRNLDSSSPSRALSCSNGLRPEKETHPLTVPPAIQRKAIAADVGESNPKVPSIRGLEVNPLGKFFADRFHFIMSNAHSRRENRFSSAASLQAFESVERTTQLPLERAPVTDDFVDLTGVWD